MYGWPDHGVDLLLMTFAAGMLDALSYLRGHAFTANMTGNTVLLGLSLLGHDADRSIPCLIALAGFIIGAACGAAILKRSAPPRAPAADLRSGVAVELPVLILFGAGWLLSFPPDALLAAAACALGIQSVAVRRLKISGVVTTFITGTITAAVGEWIEPGPSVSETQAGAPLLLVALFLTYLAAAAAGAFLYDTWPAVAPATPIAAVAIVGIRCRTANVRVWTGRDEPQHLE